MSSWYQLPVEDVLQQFGTHPEDGISTAEAGQRLAQYGPNELVERGMKSRWRILWEQFTSVMVIILIIAAIVSVALGEY